MYSYGSRGDVVLVLGLNSLLAAVGRREGGRNNLRVYRRSLVKIYLMKLITMSDGGSHVNLGIHNIIKQK